MQWQNRVHVDDHRDGHRGDHRDDQVFGIQLEQQGVVVVEDVQLLSMMVVDVVLVLDRKLVEVEVEVEVLVLALDNDGLVLDVVLVLVKVLLDGMVVGVLVVDIVRC